MKIYKIEFEVDDYQSLLVKDDSASDEGFLDFDGSSKSAGWNEPLEACIDNETAEKPAIYTFGAESILLTGRSLDVISPYIENGVEFLPVYWGQGTGSIVNVVGYSDCLDLALTKWRYGESGKKLYIEDYVFDRERVSGLKSLLFKIEDDCFETFCVDFEDGSLNFKKLVELNGFTGLSFELVWESK